MTHREVLGEVQRPQQPEPEKPEQDVVLLQYLKTLADQTRLRMLGLLALQKRSVEELAVLLKLQPSTVSWHLSRLKDIGLVEMKAEGNTHVYRMNGKGLGRIHSLLANPDRAALIGDVEMDAWERKILHDFLHEGRLKEIPAYRKKRQIILRWLIEQFERNRTYTEKELTLPGLKARGFFLHPAYLRVVLTDRRVAVACPEALRTRRGVPVPDCPPVRPALAKILIAAF
jgi:DNA-binding transcriptional ArsR family regulator